MTSDECLLPFEREKRETITVRTAKTSDKFGKYPSERTVEELMKNGIVNIDKPKGPTSHQVSAYVQKILEINKSGHSGTLDPGVTGMLPTALSKGTKIVEVLLKAGKEYVCLMHIHKDVEEENLRKTLKEYIGSIKQLPPKKSAVKRKWRSRSIYYIKILEIDGKDILFRVGCEAGTYIRKLCHDIGKKLGCGAHMSELRRTKAGPFNESTSVTLHDLSDAYSFWKEEKNEANIRKCILPLESGAEHLPKIWVLDSAVNTLCHGADLNVPGISRLESGISADKMVAVFSLKDELVAIGNSKMTSQEMVEMNKGLVVKTDKVFMDPGIYPKIQKFE